MNSWETGHLTWAGWAHYSWRFGHTEALRKVGPEMPERGSKTSTVPFVRTTFGIFSTRSKWWSWTKPGYITMIRRQSNNQWSGGIAPPRNSECKNPLQISRLEFLGSRRHPPHWLSSKGPSYQRGVLLISAGTIEWHFKGKRRGKLTRGVLFLHDSTPAHRPLATRKKLAYLGFQCLDHPPYSPHLDPSDYYMFSGLKKTIDR